MHVKKVSRKKTFLKNTLELYKPLIVLLTPALNDKALSIVLQVLEKVLTELERVCIAEQDFCFKFFHLIDRSSAKEEEQEKVSC